MEEPQGDPGVSCADDLSRDEGPFNEMVARGVLLVPPLDLQRGLPKTIRSCAVGPDTCMKEEIRMKIRTCSSTTHKINATCGLKA